MVLFAGLDCHRTFRLQRCWRALCIFISTANNVLHLLFGKILGLLMLGLSKPNNRCYSHQYCHGCRSTLSTSTYMRHCTHL